MAGDEERILVSVRLRPVNAREAERGDGDEWECAGPTTLKFLGNIPERAMFPATYTYGTYVYRAPPPVFFFFLLLLAAHLGTMQMPLRRASINLLLLARLCVFNFVDDQTGCSARSATRGRCTRKGPRRSPSPCSPESTVRPNPPNHIYSYMQKK